MIRRVDKGAIFSDDLDRVKKESISILEFQMGRREPISQVRTGLAWNWVRKIFKTLSGVLFSPHPNWYTAFPY